MAITSAERRRDEGGGVISCRARAMQEYTASTASSAARGACYLGVSSQLPPTQRSRL